MNIGLVIGDGSGCFWNILLCDNTRFTKQFNLYCDEPPSTLVQCDIIVKTCCSKNIDPGTGPIEPFPTTFESSSNKNDHFPIRLT